jgi:outer membrane autotransporter protein
LPWAVWLSGTVTLDDDTNTSTNPGYAGTTGSPTLGLDYRICPDLVLGGLVNFTDDGLNFLDGGRLNSHSELLGVYADWAHSGWFVNSLVAGGLSSYDQSRATLSPIGAQADSSPNGNEILANLTTGYDYRTDGWILSPDVGVLYTYLSKDSYTESGAGAFDLSVGSEDINSLRTKLGFTAARPFSWDGIKFTPEVHATWYHECLDDTTGVTTGVPGAPALGSFIITTNPEGRDFALAGAGLSATPDEFHDNVTFFLDYDAQVGQTNYISNTMNAGFRVNF